MLCFGFNVVYFLGVSAGTGASLVVFGFLFWHKRWKRNKKSTITLGRSYSAESSSMREDTGYTSIFSYRELQEATDNFSESKELGDGGFGTVYKGTIDLHSDNLCLSTKCL